MRALFCLLLLCAISDARGQVALTYVGGLECVFPESIRLLARGVSEPSGPDAVSTDGFGIRTPEASGEMNGLRTASILDDAVLAWRTPTMGDAGHIVCLQPRGLRSQRTVHVSAEVGNETGDPGPLRYLDPLLPNVDKIGPDYEAAVRLGRHTSVSGRWRDFLPTDPSIAPRVFDAVDGRFPKRKGLALAAVTRLGNVEVSADALGAEDLPFEETLGREVPVRRQRLGGRAAWGSGATYPIWSADVAVRSERLDRPEWSALASGVGPDWRETVAETSVRRRTSDASSRWWLVLGGTLRQRLASGPGLADGSVTWGEAQATLSDGRTKTAASARLSVASSGVGGEATLRKAYQSADAPLEGNAAVTLRRDLPENNPALPFWVARGYTGLASTQTPLALDGVPRPEESLRLKLDAGGYNLSASGDLRVTRGETVLLPRFALSPEAVAVNGPVRAVSAAGVTADLDVTWGQSLRAAPQAPAVHLTVWARAALPLAGDDAFHAARDREPTLRAGLSADHSPDGLLNLNGRLEWRAATHWDGWPEPDVPAALLLDLGLSRSFADDRIEITLTGRNVLGAPEQTHPLGATLDGRLFVRVEARF